MGARCRWIVTDEPPAHRARCDARPARHGVDLGQADAALSPAGRHRHRPGGLSFLLSAHHAAAVERADLAHRLGAAPATEISALNSSSVVSGKKKRKRSEEHTSELQSPDHLVCRLLLEK